MTNETVSVLTLAQIKRVGTDDNFRTARAAAVVDFAPEGYDWTARGAVPAMILASMGLTEHPEQQKVGKQGEQRETTYGTGFRVLADAVRKMVKESAAPEAGVIRIGLSGEGGETLTLRPTDGVLYEAALLLLSSPDVSFDSAGGFTLSPADGE